MNEVVINIAGYDVIVSVCDYARVMAKNWKLRTWKNDGPYFTHGYWKDGKRKHLRLHRFIMDCPEGMYVDHKSGNTLDNRRENLRICTKAENTRNCRKSKKNTSGYKGVSWHKRDKKWRSEIRGNYKKIHLGFFDTPEKAYEAYVDASHKYHGEYGRIV